MVVAVRNGREAIESDPSSQLACGVLKRVEFQAASALQLENVDRAFNAGAEPFAGVSGLWAVDIACHVVSGAAVSDRPGRCAPYMGSSVPRVFRAGIELAVFLHSCWSTVDMRKRNLIHAF